jgi:hypothetical protein
VIIHVAVALMALLAFTAMVVDYGAMWVGRRQAQNAADAGALAGVIALVRDSEAGTVDEKKAFAMLSARQYANANVIYGAPNSDANVDVTLSDTGTSIPPCGENPGCVRVDVMRNMPDRTGTTRGTPIPTFLAPFMHFLADDQGVRATATAWAYPGNTSECLKPWAVADKWVEFRNGEAGAWPEGEKPWEPTDTFDKWVKSGPDLVPYPNPIDSYTPHGENTQGSGFTPATDNGLQMMLKLGTDQTNDAISSGWFKALELPCESGNQGADCYRENIYGCTTLEVSIGDTLTVSSENGMMAGPTEQGVMGGGPVDVAISLVGRDPNARWVKDNPSQTYEPGVPQPGKVMFSAFPVSPRIVPVALFNIDEFLATDPNGKSEVTISNIMGFFIEGTCSGKTTFAVEPYNDCQKNNGAVVGRLVDLMGTRRGDTTIGDSSFIQIIQLVR